MVIGFVVIGFKCFCIRLELFEVDFNKTLTGYIPPFCSGRTINSSPIFLTGRNVYISGRRALKKGGKDQALSNSSKVVSVFGERYTCLKAC